MSNDGGIRRKGFVKSHMKVIRVDRVPIGDNGEVIGFRFKGTGGEGP